jgi:D-glycero-D-manno-heptose 1,7-bisphosphate phosphatase
MKKRAVFLDRDGTINKDVGYPDSFRSIEIFPCSFEAVRQINKAGLLAVIITNQSGVGRGLIAENAVQQIHLKLQEAFARHRARIDGIYYCPHYLHSAIPEYRQNCTCRKPLPGMALQAASDLNIDIKKSYMIGDKVEDILFGLNIEAKPILVLTGFGLKSRKQLTEKRVTPAHVAPNLLEAVNWILHEEKNEMSRKD